MTEKIDEIIKSHKRWCNCNPRWEQGEFGQELVCQESRSLLWWPMVESSSLNNKQSLALFCALPMKYDSDGDSVNNMLLKLGYREVNSKNFQEAYSAVQKQLECELWQDNVGKQLLGRLFSNDL